MKSNIFLGLLTMAFLISGCDSVRHTFGLDHYQADEMKVDPNLPLTSPPNLKLRPPRPGAPNLNHRNHADEAAVVLTGHTPVKPVKTHPSSNKTEDIVLNQAAVTQAR